MHCLRVKVAAGEKVAEAVAELRELETDVKECERRIRFGRDFDSIMDYFASMGALRRREAELRDSLIMDLALVEKTMQEVSRGVAWSGQTPFPSSFTRPIKHPTSQPHVGLMNPHPFL